MKGRVLVIGGGVNGLVAATRLARSGHAVTLLEAREHLGGLAAGEEFHLGFRHTGIHHDGARLARTVAGELELERHGLVLAPPTPRLAAERDGQGLFLDQNHERSADAIGARSKHDARAYREWRARLARWEPFVRGMLREAAPDLEPKKTLDLLELGRSAMKMRRLGEADMLELVRVAPMCAGDWMRERFELPLLGAALVAPALEATWLGPWSAGSALLLLARESTREAEVRGGPAAIVRALESAARAAGVELRRSARVAEIAMDSGRTKGVVLEDGEAVDGTAVISTLDPETTLLEVLPRASRSPAVTSTMRGWRARGTSAKLHLALDGPLDLSAGGLGGAVEHATTGESLDELERAFDAVKYRQMSERPILDLRVPSLSDPSLAPEGRHVVSVLAHFAPFDLEGGWTEEARDQLQTSVLDEMEILAPGTRSRVLACELLTPADLAQRYGMRGGHLHQGETAMDQFLSLRPAGGLARHATPVGGLFLGGAGTHPGGGVTGMPGWLAAERLRRME